MYEQLCTYYRGIPRKRRRTGESELPQSAQRLGRLVQGERPILRKLAHETPRYARRLELLPMGRDGAGAHLR
jgi:hypothetical protein